MAGQPYADIISLDLAGYMYVCYVTYVCTYRSYTCWFPC